MIDQIITTIYETTSRVIDRDWALRIANHILGDRKTGNAVAYVKAAIEAEPDPCTRFLPLYGGTA